MAQTPPLGQTDDCARPHICQVPSSAIQGWASEAENCCQGAEVAWLPPRSPVP